MRSVAAVSLGRKACVGCAAKWQGKEKKTQASENITGMSIMFGDILKSNDLGQGVESVWIAPVAE